MGLDWNMSWNSSGVDCPDKSYQLRFYVYTVVEVMIAFLSIFGNTLVCVAVLRGRRLRTPSNLLVVSLAVADICVGLFAIPFAIATSVGLPLHPYACCFTLSFIIITTQTSIFGMLAIAVDRYMAVGLHLSYARLATTRRTCLTIAATWAAATVIGLVPMVWHRSQSAFICCYFEEVINMSYMVYFNFFGTVLPPLVVVAAIYTRVFLIARSQLKKISKLNIGLSIRDRRIAKIKRELRVAVSLAMVVGAFAASWLPLHIINCINFFTTTRVPNQVVLSAIVLSHANSAANPVIYTWRLEEFRNAFKAILTSWCQQTFRQDEERHLKPVRSYAQLNMIEMQKSRSFP
ncbi:adenosine receptor A2b-like isoform X2 [Branchiostoma floridae]|nr:adenosine receptor A2b-like isoform X2 [Branchiostoma floridae]